MSRSTPPIAIDIPLGERSYRILIGRRLISDPASWRGLPSGGSAFVVSNTTVGPLHAEPLIEALASVHDRVERLDLPDGEAYKNAETLERIFDALLAGAFDRGTTIYALGGGVVGDMAGFAAACYMRGVDCVQVPTTLLAQVDSSVGGKTGINHPRGKNMIGAFHQPRRVVCDLDLLRTLPQREFSAGLAEVIKYGVIADAGFLAWIESHLDALMARDDAAVSHAVKRSCEIKASIVGQDEREGGLRAVLNFGHTFGHAIEAGLGYGAWLHGEAVACGMVMAAELSIRAAGGESALPARLRALCRRAGLPFDPPAWSAGRYLELMRTDKKSAGGRLRFVLVDRIGQASVRPIADADVALLLGSDSN